MPVSLSSSLIPAIILAATIGSASAEVTLSPLFSDHMVLQRGASIPIWGEADPGEEITVSVAGQRGLATADAEGKWQVRLDLSKATRDPQEAIVEGKNKIVISDVLIGEVWLASGQSNMAFTMAGESHASEEIPISANPQIRHFVVKRNAAKSPTKVCSGQWVVASPATVGSLSAVAYYFGKTLQHELQGPVGILSSSWGGTPSEAWTSAEAMDSTPETKAFKDQDIARYERLVKEKEDFLANFQRWQLEQRRQDRPTKDLDAYLEDKTSSAKVWKPVTVPGDLIAQGLPASGAVWLRRTVDIAARNANSACRIDLGKVDCLVTVYWNGRKIYQSKLDSLAIPTWKHQFDVPAPLVKEGKNSLAIRLFSAGPLPELRSGISAGRNSVSSEWFAMEEFSLPALDAGQLEAMPRPPSEEGISKWTSTLLFNGMIAPLIPYGIRGVIWYQGEGNTPRAAQYKIALTQLITDWRSRWNQGDFPFYLCQLAGFLAKDLAPSESTWAELRESQVVASKLPKTGYAVLIDIGETDNIHPHNKKTAGERLALLALAKDYGKNIEFSGPVYASSAAEGGKIRVKFTHTDGGLVARRLPDKYVIKNSRTAPLVRNSPQSEIEGFAISGKDRKWYWANARIEGDSVVVSSSAVPEPTAVRYAWGNNPTCNLYNARGLPAGPFRTDDYPLTTAQSTISNVTEIQDPE